MSNVNKTYNVKINVAWQEEKTNGKIYIKELKTRSFFYFDEVSKDIWLLMNNGSGNEEIKKKLMSKYDVDYDVVSDDVEDFIQDLVAKDIVQEV